MTAAPDTRTGRGLVPGCADPDRQAGFKAAAPGHEHAGTFGKHATLMARDGSGRRLAQPALPEPKRHKNRMHAGLVADDAAAVTPLTRSPHPATLGPCTR